MTDRACPLATAGKGDPARSPTAQSEAPHQSDLGRRRVEVWTVDLDQGPDVTSSLRAWLSEGELARAERFHDEVRGARYIVAHAALRDVLARRLGMDAREVVFLSSGAGKPEVAPEHGLSFNMSHSHGRAVIAVVRGRRVGIDIEWAEGRRRKPMLIRRFFAAEEQRQLAAMSKGDTNRAVLECWVRKEAYVKALGQGLPIPLRTFSADLSVGSPAGMRGTGDEENWLVTRVDVGDGYVAALVIEAGPVVLAYRRWTPPLGDR